MVVGLSRTTNFAFLVIILLDHSTTHRVSDILRCLTTETGEREEKRGRHADHVLPGQVTEFGQGAVDPDG